MSMYDKSPFPIWGQCGFQDSNSPLMVFVCDTYDLVSIVCVGVISLVMYVAVSFFFMKSWNYYFMGLESLEIVWVILPSLSLAGLILPSLHCLYLMDEVLSPAMSLKVVGHQWFWSYEYGDWENIEFDSYMMKLEELDSSCPFRLLEADSSVFIPYLTEVRAIITSADVIHSWAIPMMGVKVDAIPGRLNHALIYSFKIGTSYGQCSEICGAYHSFMPIKVTTLPKEDFMKWVKLFNN
uniref:Cytochrome c oxidase subunit 2 n=1 Tax=Pediculus humanus capitis TaxID=121226 RepID=X2D173_9NEOP|nr:cytochrome c oxidase subunit 2 [Pediculus humanus capitis]